MANNEKVQEALNRIEEGIANINTNEDWLKYLAFQSKFHNYSFGNIILILMQRPEASYVKGYKSWNKLGRYVKKGSKGIGILAPCTRKVEVFKEPEQKHEYHDKEGEKETKTIITGFRLVYVYDIADTDGSDEYLPVLVKGLEGDSAEERQIYEGLKAVISKEHPVVEITGTSNKGSYNIQSGVISVRSDLDTLQRIKTIIHEYAHSIDFTMNPDEDIKRNRRELVAESVAFSVSMRLGLDTSRYSIGYLNSWQKEPDEIKIIADTVQKVSEKIFKTLARSNDPAFSMLKEDYGNEE